MESEREREAEQDEPTEFDKFQELGRQLFGLRTPARPTEKEPHAMWIDTDNGAINLDMVYSIRLSGNMVTFHVAGDSATVTLENEQKASAYYAKLLSDLRSRKKL